MYVKNNLFRYYSVKNWYRKVLGQYFVRICKKKKNTKIFFKHQHSLSGIIHVFYWLGLKVEGIKHEICTRGLSIGNALLWGPSCLPLSRTLCIRPSTLLCIGPPARISSKSRRADWNIPHKMSPWYLVKSKITNKPINITTITFDPPCFENKKYTYWKINGRICSHLIDIGKRAGTVLGPNVLM